MASISPTPQRYVGQVSYGFLVFMVALVVLVSSCGITYATFKHQQVQLNTEIDSLRRETTIAHNNANQYRAKTNALTNRWVMLARLAQDGSELHDIDRNQIETAQRESGILTANYTAR